LDYFFWITVIITIASLVGVILNIKRNLLCFYIWTATNFAWFIIDLYREIYMQALLFFIYFLLAIYGVLEWKYRTKEVKNE